VTTPELAHDPFIPLALAAVATQRIQLATSVAIAFPRSPMISATLAYDLHVQSKGRFVLGLGSQVRAHNERRFSTPWTPAGPRMAEYVQSLRAIWNTWETGEKLDYQGKHYHFSLMTPEFSPAPSGLGKIPVMIAAVGPVMQRMAARHCEGVRLHGFATRRYVEEVVRPLLAEELAKAGKSFANFEITGGGFVATGPDAESVKAAAEKLRYRVGFYGSTPAYKEVLELHGFGELHTQLHQATRRGEWKQLASMVPDEVLDLFAARATYDKLPEAIAERFGGLVDSVNIDFLPGDDAATRRRVIEGIKRIPAAFQGFAA
jgi:probable F420-dependent oxidoreductase